MTSSATAILLLSAAPTQVLASTTESASSFQQFVLHLVQQLRDPWTWFGLGANGLFFLRFFWQWIVSERRKRSTVPLAFWYLSLAGATCLFIYGCHLRNLVVMLGGLLPFAIYIRNLMLIYSHADRLRRSGLPVSNTDSVDLPDEDIPD